MKKSRLITLGLIALLSFTTSVLAQPRVGEKIPEFQLQATDGKDYGIRYADQKVSIISIIGYS